MLFRNGIGKPIFSVLDLLLSTLFLILIKCVNSRIVTYNFTVTEEVIAPDLFNQKVVLVNKQYPGPEIRAMPGDIIIVNLFNDHQKNFTMHFHGLDQKGSNNADGVPYVTQYPIPPGGFYQYRINVGEQSGTYWYHGHVSFSSIGAFGPLIIEDPDWNSVVKYNKDYYYDKEYTIMISDLFHKDEEALLNKVTGKIFQSAGEIKSILINGQTFPGFDNLLYNEDGIFNSLSLTDSTFNTGNHIISVKKDMVYRFRFIGSTSVGFVSCMIPDHTMIVIETDGVLSEPAVTDRIIINSGQRYSVLVKFDKDIEENIWASCRLEERKDPNNGNFIISYEGTSDPSDMIYSSPPQNVAAKHKFDKNWLYRNLTVSKYYQQTIEKQKKMPQYFNYDFKKNYVYPFPNKIDRKITLDLKAINFEKSVKYVINGNVFGEPESFKPVIKDAVENKNIKEVYNFNNINFSTPKTPIINKLHNFDFSPFPGVYQIFEGESVELILQNYAAEDGSCFEHPWHLHGHPFYILDYGPGLFNESIANRDLKTPIFRDTDTLFELPKNKDNKHQPLSACGWKIIRFRANNPGAWLFHCHITYHMVMGMQVVFLEIPKNLQQLL